MIPAYRQKLPILLLTVVILPTALLSVLAGRSIRAREILLRQRMAETAGDALRQSMDGVETRLSAALERLQSDIGASVTASGTYMDLLQTGTKTQTAHPLIERFYVFMSPWGFVHPPEMDTRDEKLIHRLNAEIARRRPGRNHVRFSEDNAAWWFAPLEARKGLYTGFQVSIPRVLDLIRTHLEDVKGVRCDITVDTGIGGQSSTPTAAQGLDVVVSDSLTDEQTTIPTDPVALWHSLDDGSTLASAPLPAPLQFIRVTVTHIDVHSPLGPRLWNHLYRWGVALLAIVICAGSGMILVESLRLARESHLRSEFVAGMSHDLRTPVASMRMMAESLYGDRIKDPAKRRQFLGIILKECERLSDVVERILFFLRQENRAVTYAFSPMDLAHLVKSTVASFAERTQGLVDIEVAPHGDIPEIEGDTAALTKVITNLLDNAVKYGITPESKTICIHIDHVARARGMKVRLRVSDRGLGIPAREHRRIFDRFYRVATPSHEHIGGTGLGLTLCRDIVQAHGGQITIDSRPGHGTTFSVELPVARTRSRENEHDG